MQPFSITLFATTNGLDPVPRSEGHGAGVPGRYVADPADAWHQRLHAAEAGRPERSGAARWFGERQVRHHRRPCTRGRIQATLPERELLVRRADQCEAHLEAEVHRCLSGRPVAAITHIAEVEAIVALQRHRQVHDQVQRASDSDCPDPAPGQQRGQYAVITLRTAREAAGRKESGRGLELTRIFLHLCPSGR
jgi:hypothetical protein